MYEQIRADIEHGVNGYLRGKERCHRCDALYFGLDATHCPNCAEPSQWNIDRDWDSQTAQTKRRLTMASMILQQEGS